MRTDFKYALFYDFHTPVTVPGVCSEFDVEAFTDQLVRCKVDFLTWHARCNQGGAYYPTKVGIQHPGLDYDFFGKLAESCKRKNIRLSAYFNAGVSSEELIRHPEYMAISHARACSGIESRSYVLNNRSTNGLDMICGGTIQVLFIPV